MTASIVTTESAGSAPCCSTWYGNHSGAASSRSATHMVYFIGVPRVVDSVPPSFAPPQFCSTSLTARPMQPLARWPDPSAPMPELTPAAVRTGPDTIEHGVAPIVVAETPWALNSGSKRHSTAASTVVSCLGSHPAITALIATYTVQSNRAKERGRAGA